MDYHQYDVEDFVADAFFNRWVKQADDETNHFWEKWHTAHPEKVETIAQAKSIVNFLHFSVEGASEQEKQEVKTRVMERIKSKPNSLVKIHPVRRYFSIAAAVTLLLLGTFLVWQFGLSQTKQGYQTRFGEQQEILLPDSTLVKLNANSSLEFEKGWTAGQAREVWLEGEAFFEVVEQPDAADGRFIVHTGQLDVEVLGTSFNVQARHGETQVVLNTGKVKLHQLDQANDEKDIFLAPGEMATLSQQQLSKSRVNPQLYSSWKDNRLFFENESILKIAQRLSDTYGYEVKVEKEAWLELKFTGSCPADDISMLLTALSETFDIKISRNNQQIILQQYDNHSK